MVLQLALFGCLRTNHPPNRQFFSPKKNDIDTSDVRALRGIFPQQELSPRSSFQRTAEHKMHHIFWQPGKSIAPVRKKNDFRRVMIHDGMSQSATPATRNDATRLLKPPKVSVTVIASSLRPIFFFSVFSVFWVFSFFLVFRYYSKSWLWPWLSRPRFFEFFQFVSVVDAVEAQDVEAVLSFCCFGLWPFLGLWICLAVMWSVTMRYANVLWHWHLRGRFYGGWPSIYIYRDLFTYIYI